MSIFDWLFDNHNITVTDRDQRFEDLQKQIMNLRDRVKALEVNGNFPAADNSKPIPMPTQKIKPTVRSLNQVVQLMERRSALAAAMVKEAPEAEDVK